MADDEDIQDQDAPDYGNADLAALLTPGREDELAAQVAALRRQKAIGMLGLIGGTPLMQRLGVALVSDAEREATRAQSWKAMAEGLRRFVAEKEIAREKERRARDQRLADEASRRTWQEEQNRLGREAQVEAAKAQATLVSGLSEGRDIRTEGRRKDDAEKKTVIPGYKRNQDIEVRPEDVSKLRDAKSEIEALNSSIDELTGLIDKHGTIVSPFHPFSPELSKARAQMQGALTDIQMKAKGPAMYELGVLSGPDKMILDDATGNPTNLQSIFTGGAAAVKERLRGVRARAAARIQAKLTNSGYSPDVDPAAAPSTATPSAGPPQPQPGRLRVRVLRGPNTGRVGTIPPGEFNPTLYERVP